MMTFSPMSAIRAGVIGAIVFTQIGAAPHKEPYTTSWYVHAQHLVDVGGRRLNILCVGAGSPTVILDAGLGADLTTWRLVQPAIARTTRVCSYDRAGVGFSDPTTLPRDAVGMVDDLHALLRNANVSPPYVLVGWSIAGLYTRLYANRHPDDVVGFVQIDPSSEYDDFTERRTPHYQDRLREWYNQYDDCTVNVSKGTCAFFPGGLKAYRRGLIAQGCPHSDPQDCAVAEVVGEHVARPSYWKDEALEIRALKASSLEVRREERSFDNLPLIVLTESEEGDLEENAADRSGPHPVSVAHQRAEWTYENHLHDLIAALSTRGVNFVVEGSEHEIQINHPSAVISAVDEVVAQARAR